MALQPTYPRFGLFNTEERVIKSECMDQAFRIGIWFPFSYASARRTYPVLYVPDGEFAFGLATGLIPTLIGMGELPEMIVAGIAYDGITKWEEHGYLRERDFLPALQNPHNESRITSFSDFFCQELFPLIESTYRGSPENRTLFGFSAGGFFALHTMLTQPGMFRNYIAASCTWPGAGDHLLECERRYAARPEHPPASLFLAVGGVEDHVLGFREFSETLRRRNYPGLKLFTHIFEGEKHSACVLAKSFLYGLRSVFR